VSLITSFTVYTNRFGYCVTVVRSRTGMKLRMLNPQQLVSALRLAAYCCMPSLCRLWPEETV